ncbi:MAG: NAD-binding protein [SAR324 cluster bacterium]|nr:NAD-binding protein [SAR324 cluster bacterium]
MRVRYLVLIILPLLVGISTFGIYIIEGYGSSPFVSLFDSLWWTVVTFTTVGYGDMSPSTVEGKSFGILILVLGVVINSIIISLVSNWFFALRSGKEQGLKDVKMEDHIIICSDSPVFIYSILFENKSFVARNKAVIVTPLEKHPLLGSEFESVPWVHGDASKIDILNKASSHEALIGYVAYEDDADTVMTVMQLEVNSDNGAIQTMARYQIHDYKAHLKNVGCDYAIKTFDVYVPLMVQACLHQGAPVWVRELILRESSTPILYNKELRDQYIGLTWLSYIKEVKSQFGEIPFGYVDEEDNLHVNPPAQDYLQKGDQILTMVPAKDRPKGDMEWDAIEILGSEEIPKDGHIVICSDEYPFIRRILIEMGLAGIKGEIVVLSETYPMENLADYPQISWIQASSFSDKGINLANAKNARIAFIDHKRDSHTLMAVLRLENLTGGSIFTIASYREPDFDERLIDVGCDYCINVDELIAPILSQNAVHHGVGALIEQIISHKPGSQSLFILTLLNGWEDRTWDQALDELKGENDYLPIGLIKTGGNKMIVNPHSNLSVKTGDRMILITKSDERFDPELFYEPKV